MADLGFEPRQSGSMTGVFNAYAILLLTSIYLRDSWLQYQKLGLIFKHKPCLIKLTLISKIFSTRRFSLSKNSGLLPFSQGWTREWLWISIAGCRVLKDKWGLTFLLHSFLSHLLTISQSPGIKLNNVYRKLESQFLTLRTSETTVE